MRNFFSNHEKTMIKILSVIIAILLWSYVMSEVDPVTQRTYYDVPIELEGLSKLKENGLQLLSTSAERADITVVGKRKIINRLDKSDIKVTCDVSNLSEGEQTVKISTNISNPDIRVVDSSPKEINLAIDEIISTTLAIEVKTLGDLPEDFILNDINLVTKEVQIKGPRKLIDKVNAAITYMKLEDRKESVIVNSKIILLDDDENIIEDLTLEPASTEVNLSISKVKSLPIEVNFGDNLPDTFYKERVTVTPNTVTISGDRKLLNKMESIDTEPVSPAQLMNQETIQLNLNLPEGVKLVNPEETYLVRYSLNPPVEKMVKIGSENIKMQNLDPKLDYAIDENSISVIVEGDENLLNALKAEDIGLYIDGKLLKEGLNSVPLLTKAPSGINVKSIEPEIVKVTISKGKTQ